MWYFVGSFGSTFGVHILNRRFGRRGGYWFGAVLSLLALGGMAFLTESTANISYAVAIVLGLGNAIVMIASISMESDLIGKK